MRLSTTRPQGIQSFLRCAQTGARGAERVAYCVFIAGVHNHIWQDQLWCARSSSPDKGKRLDMLLRSCTRIKFGCVENCGNQLHFRAQAGGMSSILWTNGRIVPPDPFGRSWTCANRVQSKIRVCKAPQIHHPGKCSESPLRPAPQTNFNVKHRPL